MKDEVITRETIAEFLAGLESAAKMPSSVFVRLADINATISVMEKLAAEVQQLRDDVDKFKEQIEVEKDDHYLTWEVLHMIKAELIEFGLIKADAKGNSSTPPYSYNDVIRHAFAQRKQALDDVERLKGWLEKCLALGGWASLQEYDDAYEALKKERGWE